MLKAFVHLSSGLQTIVVTDLLFNLPCNEQYSKTPNGKPSSWIPFLDSLSGRFQPKQKTHHNFLWTTSTANDLPSNEKAQAPNKTLSTDERRKRFAKDAEAVAKWNFDRIIPCHGDTIETGGKQAWLDAYTRVGSKECTRPTRMLIVLPSVP